MTLIRPAGVAGQHDEAGRAGGQGEGGQRVQGGGRGRGRTVRRGKSTTGVLTNYLQLLCREIKSCTQFYRLLEYQVKYGKKSAIKKKKSRKSLGSVGGSLTYFPHGTKK